MINTQDLAHLKKLITLCKALGVASIEADGVKLTFFPGPPKASAKPSFPLKKGNEAPTADTEPAQSSSDSPPSLSDEDILFYSTPQA